MKHIFYYKIMIKTPIPDMDTYVYMRSDRFASPKDLYDFAKDLLLHIAEDAFQYSDAIWDYEDFLRASKYEIEYISKETYELMKRKNQL